MKKPVDDAFVAEFTKRLRAGGPVGAVLPYPLSECGFTEVQKLLIKEARKARKQLQKKSKPQPSAPPQPSQKAIALKPATSVQPPALRQQTLTKLKKMLYLQQGKCFFCGEKLAMADANIEHLHPLSIGGTRTEDNEVVCHKSLNETFGNLPLKRKFEFVLRAAGSFRCP
jgi:CRISPR/Cas system Type II protein with McrA/HNH and RuvC-like nuclease domain